MAQPPDNHNAIIWTDSARVDLVGAVLDRLPQTKVLAIGGPSKGSLAEFAARLDLTPQDDLRSMLLPTPDSPTPHSLLLATGEGLTSGAITQARDASIPILALEPPAAHQDEVVESDEINSQFRIITAPSLRLSPGWIAAADPQDALGRIRALQISVLAPPSVCSLYARLYDAFDMAIHLLGLPESIDAALTGPLSEPPDRLRALTGHITAHLRFTSDAAATLTVSDRAATWDRRLLALGASAQITLHDSDYKLINADGQLLDALQPPTSAPQPADLIARLWTQLQNAPATPSSPQSPDPRQIIACCDATLLSARTAQPESPATMLRLGGG